MVLQMGSTILCLLNFHLLVGFRTSSYQVHEKRINFETEKNDRKLDKVNNTLSMRYVPDEQGGYIN